MTTTTSPTWLCNKRLFCRRWTTLRHSDSATTRPIITTCIKKHNNNNNKSTFSTSSSSSVLLFVSNILPQPSASAAGVRTSFMLEKLSRQYQVHVCTAASSSAISPTNTGTQEGRSAMMEMQRLQQEYGISFHLNVPPNNSQAIQKLLEESIGGVEPAIIVFDRFYNEEAYSFQFHRHCPNSLLVLDMQDLHCLRHGRQAIVQKQVSSFFPCTASATTTNNNPAGDDDDDVVVVKDPFTACLAEQQVMNYRPSINDDRFLRELTSCHRSDLVLVCSPVEYDMMVQHFQLSPTKLCLASFWIDGQRRLPPSSSSNDTNTSSIITQPSNNYSVAVDGDDHDQDDFAKTRDFIFVGGFRHDPNVDAVQVLQEWVWPRIRPQLPTGTKLYVYGAYREVALNQPKRKDRRRRGSGGSIRHDPSHGFHIMKYTPSLDEIFANKRVSLAPLRFGAGIKGKIIDSWKYGVPVVTTPVGTEGMTLSLSTAKEGGSQNLMDDPIMGIVSWGGIEASTLEDYCQAAIDLYSNQALWSHCRSNGAKLLEQLYPLQQWDEVERTLQDAAQNCTSRRNADVLRAMTWHQTLRSTEFFSKWIEARSRQKDTDNSTTTLS